MKNIIIIVFKNNQFQAKDELGFRTYIEKLRKQIVDEHIISIAEADNDNKTITGGKNIKYQAMTKKELYACIKSKNIKWVSFANRKQEMIDALTSKRKKQIKYI